MLSSERAAKHLQLCQADESHSVRGWIERKAAANFALPLK
jgi:hypothetical protein